MAEDYKGHLMPPNNNFEVMELINIRILNICSELFFKSTLVTKSWKIPKKEPSKIAVENAAQNSNK